jgi:hypothetical protein
VRCYLRMCSAFQSISCLLFQCLSFETSALLHLNARLLITIFQLRKLGKISRLPWSFQPEQSKGVYIFRTSDQESDEVVWQIGIGHGDTKTKPRRLIVSDVDGEQIKVIPTKGSATLSKLLFFIRDVVTVFTRLFPLPPIFQFRRCKICVQRRRCWSQSLVAVSASR